MRMKITQCLLLGLIGTCLLVSCGKEEFGANKFDPNTPITVNQFPTVKSFSPKEAKAGDEVTIIGQNFSTALKVTFGGKDAKSFEIVNNETIKAIVDELSSTGAVAVTNEKGVRSLGGFKFIKPEKPEDPRSNLALNGEAKASEPITGAENNINDGDIGTWWQARKEVEPKFVELDLRKSKKFKTIIMYWDPGAAATDFTVSVSEDQIIWKEINVVQGWDPMADKGVLVIEVPETQARYIKFNNMQNNASPWDMTLKELEVYSITKAELDEGNEPDPAPDPDPDPDPTPDPEPTPGPDPVETPVDVNLAMSKDGNCSSNEGAYGNAVYGDPSFSWQAGGNDNEWFKVDLGDNYSINNVTIQWDPGAYAKDCEILISTDGENFTSVKKVTDFDANAVEPKGVQVISLDKNVTARYVKAVLTKGATPWNMTIKEFEVYNKSNVTPDPDPTPDPEPTPGPDPVETPVDVNLAKSKSGNCSSNEGAYGNAVYGDTGFSWQAGGNENEWFKVDLGDNYSINNVTIQWDPGAYAKDCEILISTDGESFTSVKKVTDFDANAVEPKGVQVISLDKNVTARYVKAVLTKGATPWNMTIKEFEVYNKSK